MKIWGFLVMKLGISVVRLGWFKCFWFSKDVIRCVFEMFLVIDWDKDLEGFIFRSWVFVKFVVCDMDDVNDGLIFVRWICDVFNWFVLLLCMFDCFVLCWREFLLVFFILVLVDLWSDCCLRERLLFWFECWFKCFWWDFFKLVFLVWFILWWFLIWIFDFVLDEILLGEEIFCFSLVRWWWFVEGVNLWFLFKSFLLEIVFIGSFGKDCVLDSKVILLRVLLINWFLCLMRDFFIVFFSVLCIFLLLIEFNILEIDWDFLWIDFNLDFFGNLEEVLVLILVCLFCKIMVWFGGFFLILVFY